MAVSVSVIVPVYNAAQYLQACLESLRCQTLESLEVIMVDDASTDHSLRIAQHYARSWPERFRHVILARNGGIGAARNAGLTAARGDFVGFVDSDDTVEPEMFARLYAAASARQAAVVLCGLRTLFHHHQTTLLPTNISSAGQLLTNSPLLSPPWNKLYSRAFLQTHGILFPEASMSEDMAFAFKVMVNEPVLACVPEALYNYHKHETNITLDIARRKGALRSVADMRGYLVSSGKYTAYKKHYYYLFFTHLVYYPLCLLCIDAVIKGHGRWKNIRNAPSYFYELLLFCLRG